MVPRRELAGYKVRGADHLDKLASMISAALPIPLLVPAIASSGDPVRGIVQH